MPRFSVLMFSKLVERLDEKQIQFERFYLSPAIVCQSFISLIYCLLPLLVERIKHLCNVIVLRVLKC